jgi:hypothetical protein
MVIAECVRNAAGTDEFLSDDNTALTQNVMPFFHQESAEDPHGQNFATRWWPTRLRTS